MARRMGFGVSSSSVVPVPRSCALAMVMGLPSLIALVGQICGDLPSRGLKATQKMGPE